MADVFISYSKVDRLKARELADYLSGHGYSVWWDTELYGGDDFHNVILQEINTCRAVVVIWSENSVKSDWVRGEAQHAQSQKKLIPTKFSILREADIPLNFRALHTDSIDDRKRILRSVGRMTGKEPGLRQEARVGPYQYGMFEFVLEILVFVPIIGIVIGGGLGLSSAFVARLVALMAGWGKVEGGVGRMVAYVMHWMVAGTVGAVIGGWVIAVFLYSFSNVDSNNTGVTPVIRAAFIGATGALIFYSLS